ncbi:MULTISPECIES: mandelate racemase/muconate lactonizing enzyme family protein [Chelativorans]|uniref:Mandelate racemase/muconate lactonizing enzyme-like protein n=1 Tax=Chelativorans sp. (strain BNC1) TaxID=266779 RepID=Q11AU3_CHESB|nr:MULTISPECIES: mandelate racemase/muconate lactonizing enzyme family protein [Chelativorans]
MKITNVEAVALDVPIMVRHRKDPFVRQCNLVRIDTDSGISGYGYTSPGEWHSTAAKVVNDMFRDVLIGQNPCKINSVISSLSTRFNRHRATGAWASAVSMVDIGLWDLLGKLYGVPTSVLLGGARTEVPVYITFGLAEYSTEELVDTVSHLVDEGHTRFKMIVGGLRSRPITREESLRPGGSHWFQGFTEDLLLNDVKRVAAVREAIGPDKGLMVDGNGAFPLGEAKRLAQNLEPFNLIWFEEPVLGNDPDLLQRLRDQTTVPIAAGQNIGSLAAHRTLIESKSYDICQLNVTHCGGYSEALKIAHLAEAHNMPIATGGAQPHHNMHFHAGVQNGGLVEFHWLSWKVGEALFVDPPAPRNGFVSLTDEPGLGLEVRPDAIEKFRV